MINEWGQGRTSNAGKANGSVFFFIIIKKEQMGKK